MSRLPEKGRTAADRDDAHRTAHEPERARALSVLVRPTGVHGVRYRTLGRCR